MSFNINLEEIINKIAHWIVSLMISALVTGWWIPIATATGTYATFARINAGEVKAYSEHWEATARMLLSRLYTKTRSVSEYGRHAHIQNPRLSALYNALYMELTTGDDDGKETEGADGA